MKACASEGAGARAVGFKVETVQYEKVGRIESTFMEWLKGETRSGGLRVIAKLLGIRRGAFARDLIALVRM